MLMKILSIHADYIIINPLTKAIRNAEELKEKKEEKIEECLVLFTAIEKPDEQAAPEKLAEAYLKEVDSLSALVKCKNIVVYPLVHLTSTPSSPAFAREALGPIGKTLAEGGYQVHAAPFGWYKGYTLKCKGHPLSELSRVIKAIGNGEGKENGESGKRGVTAGADGKKVEVVSQAIAEENKIKSTFYILDTVGNLTPAEKYDFKGNPKLQALFDYERKKVRAYAKEPPHIRIMKEHSLVDYEPASDSGNFRWYPNGRLMKKLMERYVTSEYLEYGGQEVETPLMYDYEHPALKKYLNRFPARQYTVNSDTKDYFLRFSACFGQFLIMHDSTITYKHLPLRMYELTRYSFRREQSGELAGLKRLRAFTMPDMHTLVADFDAGREEFEGQLKVSMGVMENFQVETEVAFRALESFHQEHRDWYLHLVRDIIRKPIMIEIFDRRYAYFITKFEFNYIDAMEKASALSTVQIDVENADNFDISYVDAHGQKKRPHILHASFSGSLERDVYAILETQAMKQETGGVAMIPLWLSPTQVRVIPVSDRHNGFAFKVAGQLESGNVRVDVDDRPETLGKKIRDAGREWVPYVAVVGDREEKEGTLSVTVRETNAKKDMPPGELAGKIAEKTSGKPIEKLTLPKALSQRVIIYSL